jgi:hypothetical protein
VTDLSRTVAPKSDQMNADDLIGGPRTIRVTDIAVLSGADQPVAISFEGDDGRPYKPCKSMRRLLGELWGMDGKAYIGRRMTLYRDPAVKFGKDEVGGIRISHLSDIEGDRAVVLTVTRAVRKRFPVKALPPERDRGSQRPGSAPKGGETKPPVEDNRTKLLRAARAKAALGTAELDGWLGRLNSGQRDVVDEIETELRDLAADADDRPNDDGEAA